MKKKKMMMRRRMTMGISIRDKQENKNIRILKKKKFVFQVKNKQKKRKLLDWRKSSMVPLDLLLLRFQEKIRLLKKICKLNPSMNIANLAVLPLAIGSHLI